MNNIRMLCSSLAQAEKDLNQHKQQTLANHDPQIVDVYEKPSSSAVIFIARLTIEF